MGAGEAGSFYEPYSKKRRGDVRWGLGRAWGTELTLEAKPEEPGPGSLGITLCLERGSWRRRDRWAVRRGPASLVVAQPRDQRAQRQTTTYQMGESYTSETTPHCERRQGVMAILATRGRRLPFIGKLASRCLTSLQENQWLRPIPRSASS